MDNQNQNSFQQPGPTGRFCHSCGNPVAPQAELCMNCGVRQNNPNLHGKSRIAAGILGILLGGFGIHKFYMGKIGMGILYILFCWTCIPSLIGLVEGIIYLCESDEKFASRLMHV